MIVSFLCSSVFFIFSLLRESISNNISVVESVA